MLFYMCLSTVLSCHTYKYNALASPRLVPARLLLQWLLPVFNVVCNDLGGLVSGEVAADGFNEIAFRVCLSVSKFSSSLE